MDWMLEHGAQKRGESGKMMGEWVKGDGRLVRRTTTDDSVPVTSRCRGVEIGTGVKPHWDKHGDPAVRE